jgi:hypothetical protein
MYVVNWVLMLVLNSFFPACVYTYECACTCVRVNCVLVLSFILFFNLCMFLYAVVPLCMCMSAMVKTFTRAYEHRHTQIKTIARIHTVTNKHHKHTHTHTHTHTRPTYLFFNLIHGSIPEGSTIAHGQSNEQIGHENPGGNSKIVSTGLLLRADEA